jgi:hypothetical protein
MKVKAIFKHNNQIVAEYPFEVKDDPKPGTSGDLAERAREAFDQFAAWNPDIPLVNGDVWINFETANNRIERPKAVRVAPRLGRPKVR